MRTVETVTAATEPRPKSVSIMLSYNRSDTGLTCVSGSNGPPKIKQLPPKHFLNTF